MHLYRLQWLTLHYDSLRHVLLQISIDVWDADGGYAGIVATVGGTQHREHQVQCRLNPIDLCTPCRWVSCSDDGTIIIHPAQGGCGDQVLHYSCTAREREALSSSGRSIRRSDNNNRRRKGYKKITVSKTAVLHVGWWQWCSLTFHPSIIILFEDVHYCIIIVEPLYLDSPY